MPIRRSSDPINVKRIWDAIRFNSLQNPLVEASKIVRYLQTIGITQLQAELYIKQTLKDGLIIVSKSLQKPGEQQLPTFRITPQELPELDGKDWYCFECHLAGDVTVCLNCFRVFHPDCINSAKRKFEAQKKTILNQNTYSATTINNPAAKAKGTGLNVPSDADDLLGPDELNSLEIGRENEKAVNNSTTNDHSAVKNYVYDEALCCLCNVANIDTEYDLDKSEMNYLLKFVLHRIRSWLPNTLTHTMAQEDKPEWLTDSELTWRSNQLFFEHKDMSVIEVNLNTESYSQLSEFLADVLGIQHNVAIFHGTESQEYGAAELMVRDTIHDITELRNCPDCYRHSNEKIHVKWFCLPCRVPHELVWAKQKGYPYWPAKVIRESSSHFDVRFFGGKYERALLTKSLVKPISRTKESLQIKSSQAFVKAYEELQFYQKLLKDPGEVEKLKALAKNKKRPFSKPKNSLTLATPPRKSVTTKSFQNKPNTSMQSVDKAVDDSFEESEMPRKRKSFSKGVKESLEKRKKPDLEDERTPAEKQSISANVIDISDGEEEPAEFSFRENNYNHDVYSFEETYEQVTSSTENYRGQEVNSPRRENGMQQLDHPYSDSVEKMRRKVECISDKKDVIKCAMDCMQTEIDKITNDHNEHLKRLFESHNTQISETKKKQWCFNCEQDAIYHCCWNTAYCSQTCQQQHWQAEHKKVCRRKR